MRRENENREKMIKGWWGRGRGGDGLLVDWSLMKNKTWQKKRHIFEANMSGVDVFPLHTLGIIIFPPVPSCAFA